MALNSIEQLLDLVSLITGCVSNFVFASLVVIPIDIVVIKNSVSIIKKRKKHGKIVLPAKTLLSTAEVLISKALIDSNINYNEFFFSK